MIRIFTLVCLCGVFSLLPNRTAAQVVNIPDSNFKNYLLSQPSINTNGDGEIQVTEARRVTVLNISGKNIADLTGIREFIALYDLRCQNNMLSSLDLAGLRNLRFLYSADNRLSSINIASNNELQYIDLRRNQLSALNFGTNRKLYKLNCENNKITSLDVSAQSNLVELICSHNLLTSLDVRSNLKLTMLIAAFNSLQTIDVSTNPLLAALHVYNNVLNTLTIGANTRLSSLRCNHNQLTHLDVSANPGITDLRCYVNQLQSLEIGNNANLTNLMAFQNQLTSLTLNGVPALKTLQVHFNRIIALDLKNNTSLNTVDVQKNQLQSLDLRNGHNTSITSFNARFNPPLTCIAVDDPAWAQSHWPNHDANAQYKLACDAGGAIVYIPDLNLRQALVSNPEINTNGDGVIQYSEAQAYMGIIKVNNLNIHDMTGIEAFPNISSLNCASNQIGSLNVGVKNRMGSLDCQQNQIATLVVNQAPALTALIAYSNQFTELDLSSNPALLAIDIHYINIFSIDLTTNTKLKTLNIFANPTASLDLSTNVALEELNISMSGVRDIDLSHNTELGVLNANGLFMDELDLSANTKLYDVDVSENEIPYLDFSNHPRLERLIAGENGALTGMNMKGVNILDFGVFSTIDAPNLICIEVDNVEDAEQVWRDDVEPGTSFSTDCSGVTAAVVNIPDPNFKAALVGNPEINLNGDDEIQVVEADNYFGDIFVPNLGIHDMTGLEAFTEINELSCQNNQITRLDLSGNAKLLYVGCFNNQITEIIFAPSVPLRHFQGDNNKLTSLDMSNCTDQVTVLATHNELTYFKAGGGEIVSLALSYNKFTSFDASVYPELYAIGIHHNELTSLTLPNSDNLHEVSCGDNKLTAMDISSLGPNLEVFLIENNQLNSLNIANPGLQNFRATDNPDLTCIEVNNVADAEANWRDDVDPDVQFSTDCERQGIVYIPDPIFKNYVINIPDLDANGDGEIQFSEADNYVGDFMVNGLGVSDMTGMEAFPLLGGLHCRDNNLTRLDISSNTELYTLDCTNNQITEIIFPPFPVSVPMYFFYADYNMLTSLDMRCASGTLLVTASHNELTYFRAGSGSLAGLDLSYNKFTTYDASVHPVLNGIKIEHNELTSLRLPTSGDLSEVTCGNNKLTSLDISNTNHGIRTFHIENNELTSLNAQSAQLEDFLATGNPDLPCIEVWDVEVAEANWRDDVDPGVTFSYDCDAEELTMNLTAWPNPSSGRIHIESSEPVGDVSVLDMSGAVMAEQSGAEVDISALRAGTYFMKVQLGERVSVVRVVKE